MAMCEECGMRPATIRFTMVVNGEKQEKRLCPVCMAQMQKRIPNLDLSGLAGILGGMMTAKRKAKAPDEQTGQPPVDESYLPLVCERCGRSYEEFQRTGMVGCSRCYEAFREPIEVLLTRVNGHAQHVGRMPGGKGSALSNKLAIDRLKQQLVKAIASEEYEQAASLRDQIRALTATIEQREREARANG